MRGFVSGVFWGFVTAAVVLVVVALQLGPPGAEEVVVEPALAPTAEPAEPEGEVIVTTDPAEETPAAEDAAVVAEPTAAEAPADDAVVVAEPSDGAPGAEATDADAEEGVETREDGTVVIQQTVPVEPVED